MNEIDGYSLETLVGSVTKPNESYLEDMEEEGNLEGDDESIENSDMEVEDDDDDNEENEVEGEDEDEDEN